VWGFSNSLDLEVSVCELWNLFFYFFIFWETNGRNLLQRRQTKGKPTRQRATPHSQTKLHFLGIWEDHYYTLPSSLSQGAWYGHPVFVEILEDPSAPQVVT
jgi:hypothetical protein